MVQRVIIGIAIALAAIIVIWAVYAYITNTIGDAPEYVDVRECPADAELVIDKYNINTEQIENCDVETFDLDGKAVSVVHIEYGIANDCPAGCFFSHYCAIVEEGEDYPYKLSYTNEDENILGISKQDQQKNDSAVMTGRAHRLVSQDSFNDFIEKEIDKGGPFRWCR